MIAFVGRALYWLLCAMTAPRPPVADLPPPTIQPRPAPPPPPDTCIVCRTQPQRAGTDYCGDACQAIPIPATPTLPDGSQYRRTT